MVAGTKCGLDTHTRTEKKKIIIKHVIGLNQIHSFLLSKFKRWQNLYKTNVDGYVFEVLLDFQFSVIVIINYRSVYKRNNLSNENRPDS